jgi:ribosomal protein L11 methyltransferase
MVDDIYYELIIYPSHFFDEIGSFVGDIFEDAIEERDDSFILYSDTPLDNLIGDIDDFCIELSDRTGINVSCSYQLSKKDSVDWIGEYQKSVSPIECGNFYIRASWHDKNHNIENIVIDPALAFGSGHHPTTKTAALSIQKYLLNGDTLIDVGCGSGILAIIASKLGGVVDICDTDEMAIQSSKDNFAKNSVSFNNAWVGSIRQNCKYDVVVANIIADVIMILSKDLQKATGKILILSGIIDKYIDSVKNKFSSMLLIEEICEDEWVTLVYRGTD